MTATRRFIELTYYETYYFANVVKNVLEDQFAYLRLLDEFYGDRRYLSYTSPFPRRVAERCHGWVRHPCGFQGAGFDLPGCPKSCPQIHSARFNLHLTIVPEAGWGASTCGGRFSALSNRCGLPDLFPHS